MAIISKEKQKEYRQNFKEKIRRYSNGELNYNKNDLVDLPTEIRNFHFEHLNKNLDKERCNIRELKRKNKSYRNHLPLLRLARATPKWVFTSLLLQEILDFYYNRPPGYHVDHIIPINGNNVSGLHVPWNLQYLPAKVNCQKGNRF